MKKPSAKKPAKKAKPAPPKTTARTSASNHDFTELKSLQAIKNLIEFAAEKQFDEIELERGDFRLRLSKGGARATLVEAPVQVAVPVPAPVMAAPIPAPATATLVEALAAAAPPAASAAAPEENLHIITSPIVGTFYRSSSPTAEPFAKIGDAIESGQTLCIVEAMKLMNEIQSDVSGTIVKILIENGQPVEYGQPLFGIKA